MIRTMFACYFTEKGERLCIGRADRVGGDWLDLTSERTRVTGHVSKWTFKGALPSTQARRVMSGRGGC